MQEEMGIPVLGRGNPSPWDVGPSDSVCFSPPKQVVALSEPNFWTHSLQIHCNGLGPKTVTLQPEHHLRTLQSPWVHQGPDPHQSQPPRRTTFLARHIGGSYCQNGAGAGSLNLFWSILDLGARSGIFPDGRGIEHMLGVASTPAYLRALFQTWEQ